MIIRTIIVDDERIGRERLRRMLSKEAEVEIIAECSDGAEAVTAVQAHAPDLLLLDINMPKMDGFQVLEAIGPERQPTAIIFVTAYDEHAVRAFEACALDYLLKPTSPERLAFALSRARDRIAIAARLAGQEKAPSTAAPAPHTARFTVRSGHRVCFVLPEEIDWVEAAGNYMILHIGPLNHMIRDTMGGMEAQLPADHFLRVSRSAIVNLRRVQELQSSSAGHHAAVLINGQKVPVTRPLRELTERLASL